MAGSLPLPPFAAVVVAAGAGARLGGDVPKPYRVVRNRPLFSYSVATLGAQEGARLVVLVVAPPLCDRFEERWAPWLALPCPVRVVPGGAERADSVRAGVAAVPPGIPYIAVHDAARPGVSGPLVARLREAALRVGAAVPVLPVADTLKRVEEGRVVQTVPRAGLHAVGTPQVFEEGRLRSALAAWGEGPGPTDCAQTLERLGIPVAAVEGDTAAFKVTVEEDLGRFSTLLV